MNRDNTPSTAQPRVKAGPHPSEQDAGAAMSLYAHFERAAATWPDRPALRIHPSIAPEATVLPLAPPLVPLPGTAGEVQNVPPPRPASGHRPASLLFTSGTLREPKAVVLSHTNFITNVLDILDWACLAEEEQFLS